MNTDLTSPLDVTMTKPPGARKLRTGRISEIGRGYVITTVTKDRRSLFTDFRLARLAIRELRACDTFGVCATMAFVLMPDHLHWMLQLADGTLPALLRRYKSCSGDAINRVRNTPGSAVWQADSHDHAIRDGADLQQIARYIVANPLRAGLVGSVREYPHWDAAWL